jgi:hypothetical protein
MALIEPLGNKARASVESFVGLGNPFAIFADEPGHSADAVAKPEADLEAWRAPSAAGDSANDAVFVAWREGGTSWVLSADAPPDDVLYVAARIRQARAILRVPFLGDPASMSPAGATE